MSWVSGSRKKCDKQQDEKVIMINCSQVFMLTTISSNTEEKLKKKVNIFILSEDWPAKSINKPLFSLEKSWFKNLIFTSNLSLAVFWYLMYFICVPQPWYYWDTPGPPWPTSHHVSVGRLWWSLSWCFIKIQALTQPTA